MEDFKDSIEFHGFFTFRVLMDFVNFDLIFVYNKFNISYFKPFHRKVHDAVIISDICICGMAIQNVRLTVGCNFYQSFSNEFSTLCYDGIEQSEF